MNGHRGNRLIRFEASHALADLIDGSHEIPARRVGRARRFGMNPLARKNIRPTDSRRQYFHPYLACLRRGNVLLDDGDHFWATVARDENSFVTHVSALGSGWQFRDQSGHGPGSGA